MTYAEPSTDQAIRIRRATILALGRAGELGRGSVEHLRAVRRIGRGLGLDLRGIRTRSGRDCVEVLDTRCDGVALCIWNFDRRSPDTLDISDKELFGEWCALDDHEPRSSNYAKSCYIEGVICDHIEAASAWGSLRQ